MQQDSYDFIVLGGGSGGIAAARRAAQHGARVVLLEPGALGGTCVNVGCVPKKVMWHAADLAQGLGDAAGYGFEVRGTGHDWARLKQRRDAYVARLNGIYRGNLERDGVELIPACGKLLGGGTVEAAGRRLQAPHILLATGSRPGRNDIPGAELGIDSDGFFALAQRPARVAVVGAGYIAIELAGLLHALGAQVTLLVRGERLLRSFDDMLGDTLLEQMKTDGVDVRLKTRVMKVSREGELLCLKIEPAGPAEFDALIWAVGRIPNTESLSLDAAGVQTHAHGHVMVDEWQNTSAAGIYAVGDVTGKAQLTPVAIAAGRRLADRLFGGDKDRRLDYDLIPTVVFSHPPIGTAGLSECAAREKFGDGIKVHEGRFNALYYGVLEHKVPSRVKLITAGAEERVVGCHVIGMGADELLQGFAVAMRMGATKRDFDDTIAIHPTSAEELVTLK